MLGWYWFMVSQCLLNGGFTAVTNWLYRLIVGWQWRKGDYWSLIEIVSMFGNYVQWKIVLVNRFMGIALVLPTSSTTKEVLFKPLNNHFTVSIQLRGRTKGQPWLLSLQLGPNFRTNSSPTPVYWILWIHLIIPSWFLVIVDSYRGYCGHVPLVFPLSSPCYS